LLLASNFTVGGWLVTGSLPNGESSSQTVATTLFPAQLPEPRTLRLTTSPSLIGLAAAIQFALVIEQAVLAGEADGDGLVAADALGDGL
jgi:hypothetical protein